MLPQEISDPATNTEKTYDDASSWYGYSNTIDQIRRENFSRLGNLTFLDAAGTPPYCEQVVKDYVDFLAKYPLSNPHSNNTTSIFTTNITNHIRALILRQFNTDSDHYSLVFTHNTSHSCFLLADAFPWIKHLSMCAYFQEAHHSLLGMRQTAKSRHAVTVPLTLSDFEVIKDSNLFDPDHPDLIDSESPIRNRRDIQWNEKLLDEFFEKIYASKSFNKHYSKAELTSDSGYQDDAREDPTVWNLLTISLESNFTGQKFPLGFFKKLKEFNQKLSDQRFIEKASKDDKYPPRRIRHQWKVFVDAAAFVPSAPLDLTEYPIDFLAFSFSKIFGYPTGLGMLLIKKDVIMEMSKKERAYPQFYLKRNFFSGGTVLGATSNSEERHFWHTTPSYCYTHDSSYFSLQSFTSLTDDSPQPRNFMKTSAPTGTKVKTLKMMKKDRLKRREKEREKERKSRNYLSDLELDRQFEDGTIPYTSIISLGFCYSYWAHFFTDFTTIEKHTYYVTQYLYRGLRKLRYSSSEGFSPLCEIYGSHHLESPQVQGPIVAFNILYPKAPQLNGESSRRKNNSSEDGDSKAKDNDEWTKRYVSHKTIEEKSKKWNICLRSGAFCNTGTGQTIFKYSERKYKKHLSEGGTCTESTVFDPELEPYGAARVSISYMTTKQDIDHLLRFLVVEFLMEMSPNGVEEPYASWSKSPAREDLEARPSPLSVPISSIFKPR